MLRRTWKTAANLVEFSFGIQRWHCVFMRPRQVLRPIGAMSRLRNSKVRYKFMHCLLGVALGVAVVIAKAPLSWVFMTTDIFFSVLIWDCKECSVQLKPGETLEQFKLLNLWKQVFRYETIDNPWSKSTQHELRLSLRQLELLIIILVRYQHCLITFWVYQSSHLFQQRKLHWTLTINKVAGNSFQHFLITFTFI